MSFNHPRDELFRAAVSAIDAGDVVEVERLGAALDAKDTVYGGTPLGWAEYGKQAEIAEYLRVRPHS